MIEMPESHSRLKTDKRKAPKTAFKPGQSGNPGGRPAEDPEVRENLLKLFTGKCLPWMNQQMDDEKSAHKMRICEVVAQYCLKKPAETHELTGANGEDLPTLSREEVLLGIDTIRKSLNPGQTPQADSVEQGVAGLPTGR